MFFPSTDINKNMKLWTNLGLGIAALPKTHPLIQDIQTHIDELKKNKKFDKNIFFGMLGTNVITTNTIQVWGANDDNIHVDTLDKLNKYINMNGTLGGGQAIVITKILQSGNADGLVIGIDTMSPYIKTGASGAPGGPVPGTTYLKNIKNKVYTAANITSVINSNAIRNQFFDEKGISKLEKINLHEYIKKEHKKNNSISPVVDMNVSILGMDKLSINNLLSKTTMPSESKMKKYNVNSNFYDFKSGQGYVDFANKHLGGGWAGRGWVQEEQMFMFNPVLCVPVTDLKQKWTMRRRQIIELQNVTTDFYPLKSIYNDKADPKKVLGNPNKYLIKKRTNVFIYAIDFINFKNNPGKTYDYKELRFQLEKCIIMMEAAKISGVNVLNTGKAGAGVFSGATSIAIILQQLATCIVNGPKLVFYGVNSNEMKMVNTKISKTLSSSNDINQFLTKLSNNKYFVKDPQKGGKKTRKHKGIVQIGGNIGRLRKGYKYSGKRTKTGLAEIMSV